MVLDSNYIGLEGGNFINDTTETGHWVGLLLFLLTFPTLGLGEHTSKNRVSIQFFFIIGGEIGDRGLDGFGIQLAFCVVDISLGD